MGVGPRVGGGLCWEGRFVIIDTIIDNEHHTTDSSHTIYHSPLSQPPHTPLHLPFHLRIERRTLNPQHLLILRNLKHLWIDPHLSCPPFHQSLDIVFVFGINVFVWGIYGSVPFHQGHTLVAQVLVGADEIGRVFVMKDLCIGTLRRGASV